MIRGSRLVVGMIQLDLVWVDIQGVPEWEGDRRIRLVGLVMEISCEFKRQAGSSCMYE
jgi:hypothetical protein